MDGRNGKLIREGKSATQAAAVRARGEEGGVGAEMGLLKRKRTSPPESPAPSKKRTAEEAELPKSFIVEPVVGTAGKSQAEQSRALSGDARVSKELLGQGNEPQRSALAPEVVSSFQKDVGDLQNGVPSTVENVSHGQGTLFQGRLLAETSGPAVALAMDSESLAPTTRHLIPCHAGWFQWAKIHQLERLALPEFFSGKMSKKTPEMYMEHRNCIMTKYRENPKLIKFGDVEGLLTGDVSGAVRVFGFLDHWGLINYQAIKDFSPFSSSKGLLDGADESIYGALQFSPLTKPALATLFHFEAAVAPGQKFLSTCPGPASNLPLSSSAEATVHESLAAPAVEYHCNSCQADCSKRRYHCQKQADFDLCPECYSDGKFGQGMTGTDFLRMDALTEAADASGGGWSDQETLLLLEALELYGDNWTEIAEHVATKSKAQCILHFIRLPIEDPFLEDMEAAGSVTMVHPPDRVVSDTNCTFYPIDANARTAENDSQGKTPQNGISSSNKSKEAFPLSSEQEVSVLTRTGRKDTPHETPASPKTEGKDEMDVSKHITKVEESNIAQTLLSVSECAGCTGPDGLIAFADAGNPVMTQVAFLAAMVGPRVAAAAAQAALKSLAEDDPVGFLSGRNSFALDISDDKDTTLVSDYPERSMEQQSTENHLVTCTDGPTESSDDKAASATTKDTNEMVTGSVDKTAGKTSGEEGGPKCQNLRQNIPTKSRVSEESAPFLNVRSAAASALASAAVKAKLLADQEEREIQQLVACVIENQLKKLELKLKHFSDLESMLGRECDQAERARAKVYTERARIVASRLGSSLSAIQMQPTKSTSAPATKSSSHPATSAAQPRPVVFTFGPTGVSAPAAVYKTPSGPESSSPSMPTSTSSQQGATPQRHSRAVPGARLASGVN